MSLSLENDHEDREAIMIDWKTISLKDFAGFISEELRKKNINTVLVGGACVTIYSENRYQSYDLDFVTYEDIKLVRKTLIELGFVENNGYFIFKESPGLWNLFLHQ